MMNGHEKSDPASHTSNEADEQSGTATCEAICRGALRSGVGGVKGGDQGECGQMSKASWLVSGAVPGVERQPLKKLEPDATAHYDLWVERWRRREEVGSSILSPPTIPGQLADKISSPTRESIAKPGDSACGLICWLHRG